MDDQFEEKLKQVNNIDHITMFDYEIPEKWKVRIQKTQTRYKIIIITVGILDSLFLFLSLISFHIFWIIFLLFHAIGLFFFAAYMVYPTTKLARSTLIKIVLIIYGLVGT